MSTTTKPKLHTPSTWKAWLKSVGGAPWLATKGPPFRRWNTRTGMVYVSWNNQPRLHSIREARADGFGTTESRAIVGFHVWRFVGVYTGLRVLSPWWSYRVRPRGWTRLPLLMRAVVRGYILANDVPQFYRLRLEVLYDA